jgi:hypothetical protein
MDLRFKDTPDIGNRHKCCRRPQCIRALERRIRRIPDRVVSTFGAGDGQRWEGKVVVLMNITGRYRGVGVAMIALRVKFPPAR